MNEFERGTGILVNQRLAAYNFCFSADRCEALTQLTVALFLASLEANTLMTQTPTDTYKAMDVAAREHFEAIVADVDAIGYENA